MKLDQVNRALKTFIPKKYSPLENTHPEEIFTPKKIHPLKKY